LPPAFTMMSVAPIDTPRFMRAGLAAPLLLPVMSILVWLYLLATGM